MRIFVDIAVLVVVILGLMVITGQVFGAERAKIYDSRNRIVGDIYCPNENRRCQVRDNNRRIKFYIQRDGTVTDSRRRKLGNIEELDEILKE